jgi:hypothetical protein
MLQYLRKLLVTCTYVLNKLTWSQYIVLGLYVYV